MSNLPPAAPAKLHLKTPRPILPKPTIPTPKLIWIPHFMQTFLAESLLIIIIEFFKRVFGDQEIAICGLNLLQI
jgi:hypothetical protein